MLGEITVPVSVVSGSFTSSSVYECCNLQCKWVLCFTRVKHFMALCTKNWHGDFFLYCYYNIHISPIFLLYNYTFSSYILLYLKHISSYIPIFLSLNVSGRSAIVYQRQILLFTINWIVTILLWILCPLTIYFCLLFSVLVGPYHCRFHSCLAEVWADICCLVLSVCVFVYVYVFIFLILLWCVCPCNFYFHEYTKKKKMTVNVMMNLQVIWFVSNVFSVPPEWSYWNESLDGCFYCNSTLIRSLVLFHSWWSIHWFFLRWLI